MKSTRFNSHFFQQSTLPVLRGRHLLFRCDLDPSDWLLASRHKDVKAHWLLYHVGTETDTDVGVSGTCGLLRFSYGMNYLGSVYNRAGVLFDNIMTHRLD